MICLARILTAFFQSCSMVEGIRKMMQKVKSSNPTWSLSNLIYFMIKTHIWGTGQRSSWVIQGTAGERKKITVTKISQVCPLQVNLWLTAFLLLIRKQLSYFCATVVVLGFLQTTLCRSVVWTHVSTVAPNWDLWKTPNRPSYSAAAILNWKLLLDQVLRSWSRKKLFGFTLFPVSFDSKRTPMWHFQLFQQTEFCCQACSRLFPVTSF